MVNTSSRPWVGKTGIAIGIDYKIGLSNLDADQADDVSLEIKKRWHWWDFNF